MRKLTSFLFLATLFVATFEKVHWNIAGNVSISDVFALLFLASLLVTMKRPRVPRTTAVLLGFFALFLTVYLAGYFDLTDSDALAQWGKGLTKWVIHFAFLAGGVYWLSRRGRAYFWRALAWFCGGIVVNAAYGVLQLLDARRGGNLDASLLSPITGGASQINVYGAINGASVYRPNAMTGDPNHLGIMLIVPLLILTPLYLRLEKGHRIRPVDVRSVDRAVDVDLTRAAGNRREHRRIEVRSAPRIEQLEHAVERVADDAAAEPRERAPEIRTTASRQPEDTAGEEREVDHPFRQAFGPLPKRVGVR